RVGRCQACQGRMLLLNTMIDIKTAASDGGRLFFHLTRNFNDSWDRAPTITVRSGGGMPSVFRQTAGRQVALPFSNARRGALRSTASIVSAMAPAADAVLRSSRARQGPDSSRVGCADAVLLPPTPFQGVAKAVR